MVGTFCGQTHVDQYETICVFFFSYTLWMPEASQQNTGPHYITGLKYLQEAL